jgi:hypothetical protein
MAAGDLTASAPHISRDPATIKSNIDAKNMGAATDKFIVVPLFGSNRIIQTLMVEREA